MVGAGAAASGQGDCAGGALGAAASVALNNLLSKGTSTATDKDGKPLTLEAQQDRDNLIATIIAVAANGMAIDAASAVASGLIESENNSQKQWKEGANTCNSYGCWRTPTEEEKKEIDKQKLELKLKNTVPNKDEQKPSWQGGSSFTLPELGFKLGASFGGGITQYKVMEIRGSKLNELKVGQSINNWTVNKIENGSFTLTSKISGSSRNNIAVCSLNGVNKLKCK